MNHTDYLTEESLQKSGFNHIAGVDEVGRGCFAGPLVAAAVILPKNFPFKHLINDSKLLSESKREVLSKIIKMYALSYSIHVVKVDVINKYGLTHANQLALKMSIFSLPKKADYVLVDGFKINGFKINNHQAVIHGDKLITSIAAASIIAKVYRDNLMKNLHLKYPLYKFDENKGYGTEFHRLAIKQFGLSPIHRTNFNLAKFL